MDTSSSKILRRFNPWVWLIAALCVLLPAQAAADVTPQDAAVARSLFTQGRKLLDQKNYPEACPKFEESQRLDPGIGTMFHLAVCYEGLGKTASAWSLYLEVARMAKAQNQPEKEQAAKDRAAAIEPKLTQVTIVVPPENRVPGLLIKRDTSPIGQGMWGTPVPMDGGTHTVDAGAPGFQKWATTFEVKPGAPPMTITIPKLERGTNGASAQLPPQGTTYPTAQPTVSAPQSAPTAPPVKRAPEMQRVKGLIIGGAVTLGVAWLLTGFVGLVGSGVTSGDEDSANWNLLLVPIAGPTLFAVTEDVGDAAPYLYVDTAIQAIGAGLLIAGLAYKRPVYPDGYGTTSPKWFVTPTTMGRHGLGMQLNVTNF
jgi:hypothetical protein